MKPIAPAMLAVLLAMCLLPASAGAATAKEERQMRALKTEVRALKKSRATWKARAAPRARLVTLRDREVARLNGVIRDGVGAQVGEVAKRGKISELHAVVFEPIRINWLCGSTMFQGQYLWSLDVDLEKSDYSGDTVIRTDCRG